MKGKRAMKALELRYPMTNIAKLKLGSRAEAIDNYYRIDNRKGDKETPPVGKHTYVQFYNPKPDEHTIQTQNNLLVQDDIADGTIGKIERFDNGRPVALKISTRPKNVRTTPRRKHHARELGGGIIQTRRGRHIKLT